jgi:hypothetical protein
MPRFLVSLALSLLAASAYGVSVPVGDVQPVVATDGSGYMAAWIEGTSTTGLTAVAAHFTHTSTALDAGIHLGSASMYGGGNVAIAYGGGVYLVVWPSNAGLAGAIITSDGVVARQVVITTAANSSAVAWNGSEFFVVWAGSGIFGASLSPSGVVGTAKQISPTPPSASYFTNPQIAWNGQQYVVTWLKIGPSYCVNECTPPVPFGADVMRVGADGTPLDANPTTLVSSASDPGGIFSAHLAASSESTVITLELWNRVDVVVLHPDFTLSRRTFFQWLPFIPYLKWSDHAPDIVFDGTSYVIALRLRDGAGSWLKTARIPANGDGATFSSQAIAVSDPVFVNPAPSVAASATVLLDDQQVRAISDADIPAAPAAPPAPPHDVAVAQSGGKMQVTWSGGEGADGFVVERHYCNACDGVPLVMIRNGAAHTATVAIQPEKDPGSLRVLAYNTAGVSAPSEEVSLRGRRRTAQH